VLKQEFGTTLTRRAPPTLALICSTVSPGTTGRTLPSDICFCINYMISFEAPYVKSMGGASSFSAKASVEQAQTAVENRIRANSG
jgi:hypothetical protein